MSLPDSYALHLTADLNSPTVTRLLELLKYEYVGLYGEPDPNPDGDLEGRALVALVWDVTLAEPRPVGMCGVTETYPESGAWVLRRMFVEWESRGKGLSKVLLHGAEELVSHNGGTKLWLETGTVQTAAIALYTRSGYTPIPGFGFYADSPDSIFLGKDL